MSSNRRSAFKSALMSQQEIVAKKNQEQDAQHQYIPQFKEGIANRLWKVLEGDNFVDILPFVAEGNCNNLKKNDPAYCLQYRTHRNIGKFKETIICPSTVGLPCPVCDAKQEALQGFPNPGVKNDPENSKYADDVLKPLNVSNRVIYNVIPRTPEDEFKDQTMLWAISSYDMEDKLQEISVNKRTKERIIFADPDEGKNIGFTYVRTKDNPPKYNGIQFYDRDQPITDEEWESAISLHDVLNILSYEEIKELMEGGNVVQEKPSVEEQAAKCDGATNNDLPWDDAPVEEEKPVRNERPRRREREVKETKEDNPKIAEIKKMTSFDAMDEFCATNNYDVYADEFEDRIGKDYQNSDEALEAMKAVLIELVENA